MALLPSAAILFMLVTSGAARPLAPPIEPADSPQVCSSLPGTEALAESAPRFVIVGEIHGTDQVPRLFGDIACVVARRRSVIVALEFDERSDEDVAHFLASPGDDAAVSRLLRSDIWARDMADGRSSIAMLTLLRRLRDWRAAGWVVEVHGTQPRVSGRLDQHYYELAMADRWASLADTHPNSVVLILVGSLHARLVRQPGMMFAPAASHLLPTDVVSLQSEPATGSAWNCQQDGCAPHPLAGKGTHKPAYIRVLPTITDGFNGVFSVGTSLTASAPAIETVGAR